MAEFRCRIFCSLWKGLQKFESKDEDHFCPDLTQSQTTEGHLGRIVPGFKNSFLDALGFLFAVTGLHEFSYGVKAACVQSQQPVPGNLKYLAFLGCKSEKRVSG